MRPRPPLRLALLSLFILLGAPPAFASDPPPSTDVPTPSAEPESPPAPESPSAHLLLSIGAAYGHPPALVADALFLKRIGAFAVGADAQAAATLLTGSFVAFGVSFGAFLPTQEAVHLGIVGTVGARAYSGVGGQFLSGDPGASATLGYGSARVIAAWSFGRARTRFTFGLQGYIDDDFSRVTRRYSYQESSWLSDSTSQRTATTTVGTVSVGSLFSLGATFY